MLNPKQQEIFDRCYAVYKCPKSRKQLGAEKKTWEKLKISDELGEEIFEHLLAMNRYNRDVGASLEYKRGFCVYLNNNGWEDEIPSRSEAKTVTEASLCPCCGRQGSVKIARKTFCEKYYLNNNMDPKDRVRLKASRKKHNLRKGVNETSKDFRARSKKILNNGGIEI